MDNVYVAQRRRDRDQRTATDAGVRAYLELVLADVEGGKKAEGHFGLSNGEWPATATGRVKPAFLKEVLKEGVIGIGKFDNLTKNDDAPRTKYMMHVGLGEGQVPWKALFAAVVLYDEDGEPTPSTERTYENQSKATKGLRTKGGKDKGYGKSKSTGQGKGRGKGEKGKGKGHDNGKGYGRR